MKGLASASAEASPAPSFSTNERFLQVLQVSTPSQCNAVLILSVYQIFYGRIARALKRFADAFDLAFFHLVSSFLLLPRAQPHSNINTRPNRRIAASKSCRHRGPLYYQI